MPQFRPLNLSLQASYCTSLNINLLCKDITNKTPRTVCSWLCTLLLNKPLKLTCNTQQQVFSEGLCLPSPPLQTYDQTGRRCCGVTGRVTLLISITCLRGMWPRFKVWTSERRNCKNNMHSAVPFFPEGLRVEALLCCTNTDISH